MSSRVVVSRSKQPPGNHVDVVGSADSQQDEDYSKKTKAGKPDKATALGLSFVFVSLVVLYCRFIFTPVLEAANPQDIYLSKLKVPSPEEIEAELLRKNVIRERDASPWKPDEDLVGSCGGSLKHYEISMVGRSLEEEIQHCAYICCVHKDCVAWQFREDVGCLHGGDVRLGMEKDGPGSWCHDHPPMRWQGQYVPKPDQNGGIPKKDSDACSKDKWNPEEQPGQCFGLGDRRKGIESAEACRDACCSDDKCFAWQFHPDLGCFYNKGMHGCKEIDDPVFLQPFIGRRKKRSDRTYTDKHDKPWQQTLGTASSSKPKRQRLR